MSIEITRFTQTNNKTQITQWLTANTVPDYFDSVTFDESTNAITCTMGDTAYYKITCQGASIYYNLKGKGMTDSVRYQRITEGVVEAYFDYAVKTSNGIMLHTSRGSCELVLTKTDGGSAAFVFTDHGVFKSYYCAGGNYYPKMQMISVDNSSAVTQFPTTAQYNHGQISAAKTVLAPIVIGTAGDVCPNCFTLPFNQYLGTECQFALDNVNYYSNGYVALKE